MGEFFSRGQQGPQPVVLPSKLSQEAPLLNAFWDAQAARQANATNQQQNAIQAVLGAGQLQQRQAESMAQQRMAQQQMDAQNLARQQQFDLSNQGLQIQKENLGLANLEQARKQTETDLTVKAAQQRLDAQEELKAAIASGDPERFLKAATTLDPNYINSAQKAKFDMFNAALDSKKKQYDLDKAGMEQYDTVMTQLGDKMDYIKTLPPEQRDTYYKQEIKPLAERVMTKTPDAYDPLALLPLSMKSNSSKIKIEAASKPMSGASAKIISNADSALENLDIMQDVFNKTGFADKVAAESNFSFGKDPNARQYTANLAALRDTIGNLRTGAAVNVDQKAAYETMVNGWIDRGEVDTKQWNQIRKWLINIRNLTNGTTARDGYTPYQPRYGDGFKKTSENGQMQTKQSSGSFDDIGKIN